MFDLVVFALLNKGYGEHLVEQHPYAHAPFGCLQQFVHDQAAGLIPAEQEVLKLDTVLCRPDQVQTGLQGIFTDIQYRRVVFVIVDIAVSKPKQRRADSTGRAKGCIAFDLSRSLHSKFLIDSLLQFWLNLGGATK
jgi:hypothetical protein